MHDVCVDNFFIKSVTEFFLERLLLQSSFYSSFRLVGYSITIVCLKVTNKLINQLLKKRAVIYALLKLAHLQKTITTVIRVADPDPVGSGVFVWIRIRFSNFSGSGSGFQIFWIRFRPRFWKIAEKSLKVIYQKKT